MLATGETMLRIRKRPMLEDLDSSFSEDEDSQYLPQTPQTPTKPKKSRVLSGLNTPPRSEDKRAPNKPRALFSTPLKASPLTPRATPQRLAFGKQSIYSRTKSLLQRSSGIFTESDGSLPTRSKQNEQLLDFINESFSEKKSNSLYITGPPGTGKTAQIEAILRDKFQDIILPTQPAQKLPKHDPALKNTTYYELPSGKIESVVAISINCIALNEPNSVFSKLYSSFADVPESHSVKQMIDLEHFMEEHSETTFFVVLDEIDKLVRSSLSDVNATKTIFELFLLAKVPTVKFVMIGIANSLDMKDRFLSRLNLRQDLLPKTVLFKPYSSEEMYEIIIARLNSINQSKEEAETVFNPMAIKFAAKKCSGSAGDLRKLFDILRSSIEVLELEIIASSRKNPDLNSTDTIRKVGLPHVARVFSSFMNSSSTKVRINKLNMQQKIVLCTLVHREKIDIFQPHCSLDDSYDYYARLLRIKDTLTPLKRNEFLESCNALETCGVVNIFQGRSSGKTKHMVKMIKSTIDDQEFDSEIRKIDLLKPFLTK